MATIRVRRAPCGFVASLIGGLGIGAKGDTAANAIGNLVYDYPREFGVKIVREPDFSEAEENAIFKEEN
jgi:hypothetical protein